MLARLTVCFETKMTDHEIFGTSKTSYVIHNKNFGRLPPISVVWLRAGLYELVTSYRSHIGKW